MNVAIETIDNKELNKYFNNFDQFVESIIRKLTIWQQCCQCGYAEGGCICGIDNPQFEQEIPMTFIKFHNLEQLSMFNFSELAKIEHGI